jgi:hypothetical protein
MIRTLLLSLILVPCCMSHTVSSAGQTDFDLAAQLASADYHAAVLPGQELADRLWAEGTRRENFALVCTDTAQSLRVRFLALESYQVRTGDRPAEMSAAAAAVCYAYALAHTPWEDDNPGLSGNDWGFLAYLDATGDTGANGLGSRLLALGVPAVAALQPLLDDPRPVHYAGSKDATVGNACAYQVKDVAAFYVARLLDLEVVYVEAREKRDAVIGDLQRRLGR